MDNSGELTENTQTFIFLVDGEPDGSGWEKLERKKWYCHKDGEWQLYLGECPFGLDNFEEDEIVCKSYLERIMASFNK